MRTIALFLFISTFWSCSTKNSIRFTVEKDDGIFLTQPVGFDLTKAQEAQIDIEKAMVLFQEGKEDMEIPFQVDHEQHKIWFVPVTEKNNDGPLSYRLENGLSSVKSESGISEQKRNGSLQLGFQNKPAVSYRYEMTYPPNGVDSIFKKSGYIHPIITPKGDTLTRIQPNDHYHHYGLWGPWTHTQVDGERVDFWNLGEGMGTVLFKEFKNEESGDVYASFTAGQEHIDLKTKEEPQIALNEDLQVRLWNLNRPDRYMFDYKSEFSTPLQNGILFEAYRYGGGLGLRFNERWKADNCTVLTSEGNDRLTADGTNARWCIVSGESADGKGTNGILFMSHPKNRNHPEPMRIWPIDANGGRGDMFFEFCPIRHEEWKIEPNKKYELNYRMVVFDGTLQAGEAEAYWQLFAQQPKTDIINN
ncbi:Methane oxygenase PmoA [Zobellia uliginosa]|uniref:Methane oxygenase PmoA n=1 Tax=Zobellia uliginosa TaxID=143224 RepID=A0ABY1L1X1_9FLAO|nr:PmoA family protein [Zobellia uliginosa]SIT09887.1 Methane oxygenase PmoA [Zobellia uliginosa]